MVEFAEMGCDGHPRSFDEDQLAVDRAIGEGEWLHLIWAFGVVEDKGLKAPPDVADTLLCDIPD